MTDAGNHRNGACHRITQRTFEDGTPWPPMIPNTLRLYSMRFCPYAQRARLVLAHKNIPYETVNVHLKRKPEWLLQRNPKGRVPVLEHSDGRLVYESTVVCQYLDDIYPQEPLTPKDPYRKARDTLLVNYCDRLMMAIYQLLFSDGTSEEGKATIQEVLAIYDTELKKRLPNGPFFGGSQPAMVDYLIWPWVERFPMFDADMFSVKSTAGATSGRSDTVGIYSAKFPCLHKWMTAMFGLPAVAATMFDLKSHQHFGRTQLTADPEYDLGLEDEPPVPSARL